MAERQRRSTKKRRGGVTGKGFLPGKSGNPGGRPSGVVYIQELGRKVLDEKDAKGITAATRILRAIADKAEHRKDERAARFLFEFAYGKPVQPVSGPEGGPVKFILVDERDE